MGDAREELVRWLKENAAELHRTEEFERLADAILANPDVVLGALDPKDVLRWLRKRATPDDQKVTD